MSKLEIVVATIKKVAKKKLNSIINIAKEKLQKIAQDRYREMSDEDKNKKTERQTRTKRIGKGYRKN